MRLNIYLIEFALNALLRQKAKNSFIVIIFTLLVFLLTSVFFITNALKYELNTTLDSLPEIVIQNNQAGRDINIESSRVDDILSIEGVSDAVARVWGYYYFKKADVYLTLVGIDSFEKQYKDTLEKFTQTNELNDSTLYLGSGVKELFKRYYFENYFNFIKANGELKKVAIAGVFNSDLSLEANDIVLLTKETFRDIFDMDESLATDIVVKVSNPLEITKIVSKLKLMFPTAKVLSRKDMSVSYEKLFNYKSGIFLALFIISLFTFFIIIYDKANGLTSEEKREVGILKALGWSVDDLLKEKFYEASVLSLFSYILGVTLSFAYVYILKAPLLKDIFIGYSNLKPSFSLAFVVDIQTLFLVFLLSVPIYIASVIVPSWRVATLDADEVIR
jgi:ABC-type lipoprotein release transport system permease subunit